VRNAFAVFVVAVILGLVFGSPGVALMGAQAQNQTGAPLPPAGRVIVVMKDGTATAAANNVAVEVGVKINLKFDSALNGFATTANQTQIAKLAANPNVDFIAPDVPIQAAAQTPSSAISRSAIAGFAQIDQGGANANIGIAILDSGVQNNHPDLNYAGGFNCSDAPSDQPYQGTSDDHGTHVAGIAAAKDNTSGVVGSAPGARIYNYRILDSEVEGFSSWMICALEKSIDNPDVKVINMSVAGVSGFGTSNCDGPDPLHIAVCNATNAGKLIVVAAGNNNTDAASYIPARYPEVVAVGNIADGSPVGAPGGDSYHSTSNFGSVVDLAAPGTSILSTLPGSSYGSMTGTSMAAPLVAGVAAYYMMQAGASVSATRSWLQNTASVPMSTTNGCACSAPTGSPNRMLYLGGVVTTYPPGTANPAFSGSKTTITNSASTPSVIPASYAHDNNFSTNWHTGHSSPSTASLRFDLGTSKSITGVKWRFYGLGYADSFTVKLFNSSGGEIASYGPFGNGSSGSTWYGFTVPSTSAQFVRFYFANPNGDSALGSIAEVEIWSGSPLPPGTTNPTFTGTKSAITNSASTPSVVPASYAHDSNLSTNWHSGHSSPSTASLRFDLGSSKSVTGVKWRFYGLGYADSFTVKLFNSSGGEVANYGPYGNGTSGSSYYGFSVPSTSAQYVRFYFANPNSDSALGSIAEVEIWTTAPLPPGTTNPTFSGSEAAITNSASTPSAIPSTYAYDNNLGTNWHSGHSYPSSASLRFDLGATKSITGVKWRFYALGYADTFTVKLANASGVEIATYGPFGNGTSGSNFYGFSVGGTDARFVRFYFANPNGDSALGSIAEVEIWGSGSSFAAASMPLATETAFAGMSLPIAASDADSGDPALAHDGNAQTTFAASAAPEQTVRFDLGGARDLTGLRWKSAADALVTLRTSRDGQTWTEAGIFATQPDAMIWQGTAVPAGTRARYVQVTFVARDTTTTVGRVPGSLACCLHGAGRNRDRGAGATDGGTDRHRHRTGCLTGASHRNTDGHA
jgi:hypothetical protein